MCVEGRTVWRLEGGARHERMYDNFVLGCVVKRRKKENTSDQNRAAACTAPGVIVPSPDHDSPPNIPQRWAPSLLLPVSFARFPRHLICLFASLSSWSLSHPLSLSL